MIDVPARIVSASALLLPRGRADWAAAMSAELSQVAEGPARWLFALECVRATLVAPLPPGEARYPAITAIFLAGTVGCIATWVYIVRAWPHAESAIAPASVSQFVLMLALYVWLAVRPPRLFTHHADAPRQGAHAGILLFFVITVLSPVLDAMIRTDDPDALVFLLEYPAVVGTFGFLGYQAARSDRAFGAGFTAAFWAGMVCSILSYNADLIMLLSERDLERHFRGLGGDRSLVLTNPGYFMSKHVGDHLNSTMLALRGFPILALFMGALGASLARIRDRRSGPVDRQIIVVA